MKKELKINAVNQTPIEALLRINDDGTVSAKKVYEFLELRKADYSRWCKTNIIENEFAEENIDFAPFRMNAESGGQATTEYKLSVPFAKKLCMLQKNERGEQARNYFIKVEEKLKEVTTKAKQPIPKLPADKTKRLEIQEKNARAKTAALYLRIADNEVLPKNYRGIFLSYASKELSGQDLLPLPKTERQTYSATDIGNMFGLTSNKIGRLANEHNLKTAEYGMLYHDKSRHSVKEVDSFRYYDTVIPAFEKILGKKAGVVA